MSNINLVYRDGHYVIDSRVIAEGMGVDHDTVFMKTVWEYHDLVSPRPGNWPIKFDKAYRSEHLRFHEFAWLREKQAIHIAEEFANDKSSQDFKVKLIVAFQQVKRFKTNAPHLAIADGGQNGGQIFQRFDRDGIELVINTQTGENFTTQAGYERMSGKAKSTISERMTEGVRKDRFKTAEIQTAGGIQGVRLIDEDWIVDWLPKDNPSMASKLLKLGVRMFMHELAGFKFQPQQAQPTPVIQPVNPHITRPIADQVASLGIEKLREMMTPEGFDKLVLEASKKALTVQAPNAPKDKSKMMKIHELSVRIGEITPRIVKKYNISRNDQEIIEIFDKLEYRGLGTFTKGRTYKYSAKIVLE